MTTFLAFNVVETQYPSSLVPRPSSLYSASSFESKTFDVLLFYFHSRRTEHPSKIIFCMNYY